MLRYIIGLSITCALAACNGSDGADLCNSGVQPKSVDRLLTSEALSQISDPNFSACISFQTATYADEVTHIRCNDESISSLDGIESFTSLTTLYMHHNNLTCVDMIIF